MYMYSSSIMKVPTPQTALTAPSACTQTVNNYTSQWTWPLRVSFQWKQQWRVECNLCCGACRTCTLYMYIYVPTGEWAHLVWGDVRVPAVWVGDRETLSTQLSHLSLICRHQRSINKVLQEKLRNTLTWCIMNMHMHVNIHVHVHEYVHCTYLV